MSISSVRIEIDRQGVRALLASRDVQSDLMRRAEQVASAARSRGIQVGGALGDDEIALPIEAVDAGNSSRARAIVRADHHAALAVEAKHRLLVSSLDAAR